MKKKLLAGILSISAVLAITACGGNTDTEVQETAVVEESTETEVIAKEQEEEEKAEEADVQEQAEEQAEAEEQARLAEADAYYEAGRNSFYGLDGTEVDYQNALESFTKAQELGSVDANFYLGLLCKEYNYPEKNYEKAKEYLEQCDNNPYAQIELGFLYFDGHAVDEDKEKGKELFQAAIDAGAVEGCAGLGDAAVGEEDYETAINYYQKVIDESTESYYAAYAMNQMGYLHHVGLGVEQDFAAALAWYTKAADLGIPGAMTNAGIMYRNGNGAEQDFDTAMEWFKKAADLGFPYAMNYMGVMYLQGEGVTNPDPTAAVIWFTKAANAGNTMAMENLGDMYSYGYGVGVDSDKAIEWYQKAADLGDEDVLERLKELQE